MRANRETTAGATDALRVESRSDRWRARWRFLLATVTLAVLYLAIEQVWMWGATKLMYMGWTYSDPAREYAEQAAAIAEQSKALEDKLGACMSAPSSSRAFCTDTSAMHCSAAPACRRSGSRR
jgi:hypothetical protein